MKTIDLKWKETKKKFMQNWPELSDEELEKTRQNKSKLIKLLQNKFSLPKQQAEASILEIMPHFDNLSDQANSDQPTYPNELYKEELPPDIKLD